MMKERPIPFNTEMVRAILGGRATQTRRVMKPQPELDDNIWYWNKSFFNPVFPNDNVLRKCPYGKTGDGLWVREIYAIMNTTPLILRYKQDRQDYVLFHTYSLADEIFNKHGSDWRPSIFMPRWASRITLEITNIRVERLQEITEEDAIKEGCEIGHGLDDSSPFFATGMFKNLWNFLNVKRGYSWDSNPWVWVIEFKRIEKT